MPEETSRNGNYDGETLGQKYYFPTKLIIEYEPIEKPKQLHVTVKHFLEDGTSLAGVFPNYEEIKEVGEEVNVVHPTHEDYTYVGHAKTSTGALPSYNNLMPGTDPGAFTYDGSFENYIVYFYYETDLPEQPDPGDPEEPNYDVTGDFDIIPNVINWRESTTFRPKDIETNCNYEYHYFRIEKDGRTYTTPKIYGETQDLNYVYENYPWIFSTGDHQVYMKVFASCAQSNWIGPKTLTINSPSDNSPPDFAVGWTHPGIHTQDGVVTEVIAGTTLDLVYLDEPEMTDPDGDPIEWLGFDFAGTNNSWLKSIPSQYTEYTNGWHRIKMDEPGTYSIKASIRDSFGAVTTKTARVTVVPPNPVPVASCPQVKSMRPVPDDAFDSSQSYSPLGKDIDHSRDEWSGIKPYYVNDTMEPISEKVFLHVFDEDGLKSLYPDECTVVIEPDLPPVAKLDVQPLGIRGETYSFANQSYSPDGDPIVTWEYKFKYDDENNGFDDDAWATLIGTKEVVQFKPNRVGKYLFYVRVVEDYGRADDTLDEDAALYTMDVTNLAPSVSFKVEGDNPRPDLALPEILTAKSILNWNYYQVNSTTPKVGVNGYWSDSEGYLSGGLGKIMEGTSPYFDFGSSSYGAYVQDAWNMPFPNRGYGNNGLSPYRTIKQESYGYDQPLLAKQSDGTYEPVSGNINGESEYLIRSNPKYIYYTDEETLYGMNKSKISRYQLEVQSQYSAEHQQLDGWSVDLIISPNDLYRLTSSRTFPKLKFSDQAQYNAAMENGDFEGALKTGETYRLNNPVVLDYEVSDETIYQLIRWTPTENNYSYNWTTSNGNSFESQVTNSMMEIRTYDAFTGEFIASSLDQGLFLHSTSYDALQLFPVNDDLMMFGIINRYNDSFTPKDRIIKLNRQGEVLNDNVIDGPETTSTGTKGYSDYVLYQYNPSEANIWFQGMNGDFYRYQLVQAENDDGSELFFYNRTYVMKIDKNGEKSWRVRLTGKNPDSRGGWAWQGGTDHDAFPVMLVNSHKNELVVQSFHSGYSSGARFVEVINMNTGSKRQDDSIRINSKDDNGYYIDFNGNRVPILGSDKYLTADGLFTDDIQNRAFNSDGSVYSSWSSGGIIRWSYYPDVTSSQISNIYVGDGMYIAFYGQANALNFFADNITPWLTVGTPSDEPPVTDGISLGELISPNTYSDHEYTFTLRMKDPKMDDQLAGFGFRARDPKNKYAVETDGETLYISKYVNGTRTILDETRFPFQNETDYQFKVRTEGDRLSVTLNRVPYFEVTDNTFADGKITIFSDKVLVDFGPIIVNPVNGLKEKAAGYAILDEVTQRANVTYKDMVFNDPENDPKAGMYSWYLKHTPKFINNGGLSSLHDKRYSSEVMSFDKVGLYEIHLSAQDDPHPDYLSPSDVFGEYRKDSNPFKQLLVVHRIPVAEFELSYSKEDGLEWTDTSYDPDRWASATNYSTEATGIDYRSTRGVMERKYFYIDPNGNTVHQKLMAPTLVGTYVVGLIVKDEYGAWSHWAVKTIQINQLMDDNPPVAGFTLSKDQLYRNEVLTIHSTAYDLEDGDRTQIAHWYYIKQGSGSESLQSTSRTSWNKTFNSLGTFQIRQVVQDRSNQTAEFTDSVTVINRKPTAAITYPSSTNRNNPTIVASPRPAFTWTYSDGDNDPQTQYQVRIYHVNGTLLRDTGPMGGSSKNWTTTQDLPTGTVMYVMVRVFDGYDWSEYSQPKYFMVNRPPVADFDWTPKPVWEGDQVTLLNRSSDPDGDPLTYTWQVTFPDGTSQSFTTTNVSLRFTQIGIYRIRLTASDGMAESTTQKPIEAKELIIEPAVFHTEQWKIIHDELGHQTENDPKDFYSGEIFVLQAGTSPAPIHQVTAWMDTEGRDGNEIYLTTQLTAVHDPVQYIGELYDPVLMSLTEGLNEGLETIWFEVRYANGVVKQASVPVNIIGLAKEAAGVHRRR
ncbi:PKD domain-containing protein [Marinicrinis lubricantis]|uniref:PKD domain-containing protein n=1 Tax=Marinicrinis lubricantis TaxID=2086470 RepID=A0ABW1IW41_9BACL